MAGVEFIITGTTVPLDNTVDLLLLKAWYTKWNFYRWAKRYCAKGVQSSNLLNSNLSGGSAIAANVNAGTKDWYKEQKCCRCNFWSWHISDLRKSECEVYDGIYTNFYGQACFENRTDYDLVLIIDNNNKQSNNPQGW